MHKYHLAQITSYGSPAIIITASFSYAGGYFKAESFVAFPDPHYETVFRRLRFDEKTFPRGPVELTDTFMLEDAMSQARIDIAEQIEKHYSNKLFLIPAGEFRVNETDVKSLVHLHLRNKAPFLVDIEKRTECETLRNEVMWILNLPKVISAVF